MQNPDSCRSQEIFIEKFGKVAGGGIFALDKNSCSILAVRQILYSVKPDIKIFDGMKKQDFVEYVAPEAVNIDIIAEGMLCWSPVPGAGEDMEEGDEL